jgi:hypothetical protein
MLLTKKNYCLILSFCDVKFASTNLSFCILFKFNSKETSDYLSIKQDLQSKNQQHLYELVNKEKPGSNGSNKNFDSMKFSDFPKYAYEALIRPVEELPENIMTDSKEVNFRFFDVYFFE